MILSYEPSFTAERGFAGMRLWAMRLFHDFALSGVGKCPQHGAVIEFPKIYYPNLPVAQRREENHHSFDRNAVIR